jgi:hypothetical protein
MSTLAEFPQGIPIPTEEIRSALESVAIPGYTGTIQLEIGLRAEAASCVMIGVIRRQSKRVDHEPVAERQMLPDPKRRKPVEKVMADLKGKLFVRTVMTAVEAHYLDGVLQKVTTSE